MSLNQMNQRDIIALGVVLVVIVVVVAVVLSSLSGMQQQQDRQIDFCNQWSLNIEQRRAELSGEFFQTDQEWSVFNQQVNEYNRECAR